MIPFTKISTALWSWKPWLRLEHDPDDLVGRSARLFWLAIYTCPETKRSIPGLLNVSVTGLAEMAGFSQRAAYDCFDRLLDHDLVEYDQAHRVVRMTMFPDGCEAPTNGNTIRAWWRRFLSIPQCEIRDAHVATIRETMEQWSREAGKPVSPDHAKAWADTFASVHVPPARKRGVSRLLGDSDTGTAVQPSLFPKPRQTRYLEARKGSQEGLEPSSGASSADSAERLSVERASQQLDPKTVLNDPNPGRVRGRVLEPTGSGEGEGSSSLSPEEGGSGGEVRFLTVLDGGFDHQDLWAMLRDARADYPREVSPAQLSSLAQAIDALPAAKRTPAVLAVLREYIACGMEGFPRPPLTAEERCRRGGEISPEVVGSPGWLSRAIEHAHAWKQRVTEKLELAQLARQQLGYDPKPT